MIAYDASQPLVFIHVPKCAGTSTRLVFEQWFGQGMWLHYINPWTREHPEPFHLEKFSKESSQLIYGHFNRAVGLNLERQVPQARQFVTILRDPLEAAISDYFFQLQRAEPIYRQGVRRMGSWVLKGGFRPRVLGAAREHRRWIHAYRDVEDFLVRDGSKMLDHFPVVMTEENYIDVIENQFVEIGVVERLEDSIRRIAVALGRDPEKLPELPRKNRSRRSHGVSPEAEERLREKNALSFKVYEYALARLEAGVR